MCTTDTEILLANIALTNTHRHEFIEYLFSYALLHEYCLCAARDTATLSEVPAVNKVVNEIHIFRAG